MRPLLWAGYSDRGAGRAVSRPAVEFGRDQVIYMELVTILHPNRQGSDSRSQDQRHTKRRVGPSSDVL